MNDKLRAEAKKHHVSCIKVVLTKLPGQNGNGSAKELFETLKTFFKDYEIDDANFAIEVSGCGGCGGYLDDFYVSAEVEKSDDEIKKEIETMKGIEAYKRKEYRENAKKRKEYELKELARLKKKYGG